MCGRYGRRADKQRIAEWMQAHDTGVFDDSYFSTSYNVAFGSSISEVPACSAAKAMVAASQSSRVTSAGRS
jgi:hypothetical protein